MPWRGAHKEEQGVEEDAYGGDAPRRPTTARRITSPSRPCRHMYDVPQRVYQPVSQRSILVIPSFGVYENGRLHLEPRAGYIHLIMLDCIVRRGKQTEDIIVSKSYIDPSQAEPAEQRFAPFV